MSVPNTDRRANGWLPLLLAVILVVAAVAAYFLFFNQPASNTPSTQATSSSTSATSPATQNQAGEPTMSKFSLTYPYNRPTSIQFQQADLEAAWQEWKTQHITNRDAGEAPRLRVMGGTDYDSTVSEGMSYGLLFSAIFDEQPTFDGLWLFTADYLDRYGLMDWHIARDRTRAGTGGATDADEDIALALIYACSKVRQGVWQASSNDLDYCAMATTMINTIWLTEIDQPGVDRTINGLNDNVGYELMPGDQWNVSVDYPQGIVNLSYFAPYAYDVFARFTGKQDWHKVIARNYDLLDTVQAKPGNCSGLVANWNTYAGDAQIVAWQNESSRYFGWDGARLAWRLAVDQTWFERNEAVTVTNRIGSFFANVGVQNIGQEYSMEGTAVNSAHQPFFVANGAAAVWAAPQLQPVSCGDAKGKLRSTPQQAYDELLKTKVTDSPSNGTYYGNAWRLFAMLLLTGNFPNPLELHHFGRHKLRLSISK